MDIIKLFNERKNKDDEFEIILTWDKHQAQRFINASQESFLVSKCIDFYDDRNRMRVEKGKPNVSIHKKLIDSTVYQNYRINLKEEIPIDDFNKSKINTVRLKYSTTYLISLDKANAWELVISKIAEIADTAYLAVYKKYLEDAESFDAPTLRVFNLVEVELEYKGSSLELSDLDIVYKVDSTDNNFVYRYLSNLRKECNGKYTKYFNLKSILPNPIGLEKNQYKDVWKDKDNWFISSKYDGLCTILFIKNKKLYLVNDKETKMGQTSIDDTIIIQGELMDKDLFAYDILFYKESLCKLNYAERIKKLKDAINTIGKIDILDSLELKEVQPLTFGCKKMYNDKNNLTNDGLILTPNGPYFDSVPYKWKPLNDLTIDFLIIKPEKPEKRFVEAGKTTFYLFTTISKMKYDKSSVFKMTDYDKILKDANIVLKDTIKFPIQFSTPRDPFLYIFKMKGNDKRLASISEPCIGEFRYNAQWEAFAVR